LLPKDMERINSSSNPTREFATNACLPKNGRFCSFLKNDSRCTIYENRPHYCRTFPFYIESDFEVDIDLSCPGVGRGNLLGEDYFAQLCQANEQECAAGKSNSCDFLNKAFLQGRLDPVRQADFVKMGVEWFDSACDDSFYEMADSALVFSRQQMPTSVDVPELFNDFFDLTNCMNVHFTSETAFRRYAFGVKDNRLTVDGYRYPLDSRHDQFGQEGLDIVREYMKIWFKRSIFYKFCVFCSSEAPMLYTPVSIAFEFAANLLKKIGEVSCILTTHWSLNDDQINEVDMLKEAVRLFDGRLRTKCRSVAINSY
jgi:Fe-S-cluster containining protein